MTKALAPERAIRVAMVPRIQWGVNTPTLVDHQEATLRRLENASGEFPGVCCACLQDVGMGHLPSCYLAQALEEVGAWRA